jgi:hypothetical protein
MAIVRTVSINKAQDAWLEQNVKSLSTFVQLKIEEEMKKAI